MNKDAVDIYDTLKNSGILYQYIFPCYDVLHTQEKDYIVNDIVELMKEMFDFISKFEGDIPGASAIECGNYLDQNLPMARYEAKKYLEETLNNIKEENLIYPE